MKRAALALLLVAVSAGCDPGPLPQVPRPTDPDTHRFPSESDHPFELDRAIMRVRIDEVRSLLQRGANPNRRWASGDRFPLQAVFENTGFGYQFDNRAEFVRALLDHGADPNQRWCPFETRGDWGPGMPSCTSATAITALHFASFFGDRESVTRLLEAGASPLTEDWTGATPLQYAYDEVVFELLSRAMFPDVATRDAKALAAVSDFDGGPYLRYPWAATAISRAILEADGMYIVPPPPPPPPPRPGQVVTEDGPSADALWSKRRSLSRLRTLLRIGADPNERIRAAGFDWPPLALALSERFYRAAELLLQNKSDVNKRWCTTTGIANHRQIGVKADASCNESNGRTALMWSAAAADVDAVRLLLQFNADRGLKDSAGRTALDHAANAAVQQLLRD